MAFDILAIALNYATRLLLCMQREFRSMVYCTAEVTVQEKESFEVAVI
ncbi:MAG: hypothetical protein QM771_05085 [Nitrospira sp.]